MSNGLLRRPVLSWAFYDWANSAFATTVMAGFFPVFFKSYWSPDVAATVSTFRLGVGSAVASLAVAFLAPALGAIADRWGARKRLLLAFAGLGVVMTGGLFFVQQGMWPLALGLYVVASIGFAGGNLFNDSLLIDVAGDSQIDQVSALGFSLGYLGGGVLFAINVMMTLNPDWFGLASQAEAVRWSLLSVAVWWTLFSIPLWLFVEEKRHVAERSLMTAVREGLTQLADTFRHIRQLREVFIFLGAYWLYIDGVHTIIRLAVDYGLSIGFEASDLLVALLLTQFVGFPAALAFGWLGRRIGARRGIFAGLGVYVLVTLYAVTLNEVREFYVMAVAVGLVQGGVQSLSRSFFARLIPAAKAAEFFGFYNMLGKFAAVIGPLLVAWVALLTGDSRLSILSVVVLFLGGGALLLLVNEREAFAKRLGEATG